MKIKITFIFFLLCSCTNYFYPPPKENSEFLRIINKKRTIYDFSILFNGYYNNETSISNYLKTSRHEDQIKYSIDSINKPLIFFKNGLVYFSLTFYKNEINYLPQVIKMYGESNWGTYEVVNDTIKAVIYCQFNNKNNGLYCYMPCYFEGQLNDKETITNWRMIEPTPDIIVDANKYRLAEFKTPSTLKFKTAGGKNKFYIDSNAVWVNKYRK